MTSYKVAFEREADGTWHGWVLGQKKIRGQGRSLAKARQAVRRAIRRDVKARTIDVVDQLQLSPELNKLVEQARAARSRADEEEQRARALEGEVCMRLTKDVRLSRRAIGELLGLSHAMIQRIIDAEKRARGSWKKGRRYGVAWGRGM